MAGETFWLTFQYLDAMSPNGRDTATVGVHGTEVEALRMAVKMPGTQVQEIGVGQAAIFKIPVRPKPESIRGTEPRVPEGSINHEAVSPCKFGCSAATRRSCGCSTMREQRTGMHTPVDQPNAGIPGEMCGCSGPDDGHLLNCPKAPEWVKKLAATNPEPAPAASTQNVAQPRCDMKVARLGVREGHWDQCTLEQGHEGKHLWPGEVEHKPAQRCQAVTSDPDAFSCHGTPHYQCLLVEGHATKGYPAHVYQAGRIEQPHVDNGLVHWLEQRSAHPTDDMDDKTYIGVAPTEVDDDPDNSYEY